MAGLTVRCVCVCVCVGGGVGGWVSARQERCVEWFMYANTHYIASRDHCSPSTMMFTCAEMVVTTLYWGLFTSHW